MTTIVTRPGNNQPSVLDLLESIVHASAEVKGKDVVVLDVSKIFNESDYFVVVSGRSDRQVQGISNRIIDAAHQMGIDVESLEGIEQGQWVLLDFGDIVVHVFYEPMREHYDIEGLWSRGTRYEVEESSSWTSRQLRAA